MILENYDFYYRQPQIKIIIIYRMWKVSVNIGLHNLKNEMINYYYKIKNACNRKRVGD